jgi:hypothetical protein
MRHALFYVGHQEIREILNLRFVERLALRYAVPVSYA